jgi:uncharacterized protein YutE (UPF0331/DUF86 family)
LREHLAIAEAIGKGKRKEVEDVNVLYQADFIHLGEVLFKAYPSKSVSELFDKLDKAQKLEDLNFTDLKEYGPQSNWKRYFSEIVECSNDYLDKKWNELYNLRCAVAHNSIVGKAEFERIERLVNEVGEYLQKAIDNLDKVYVPTEDKEQLAENIVGSINLDYETFLQSWRVFVSMLTRAVTDFGLPPVASPYDALDSLSNNGFLDESLLDEGLELLFVRDQIVHDSRAAFTQQELNNYILRMDLFIRILNRSWKEEVIDALKALGGSAQLADIYKHIESKSVRRLPVSWKSAVRKTLYIHSSDTEVYKGGEDLFEHLDKGLWGLRDKS